MTTNNDAFALEVWRTAPELKTYSRRLWAGDYHGAEDGIAETVCRAIRFQHKFTGGNLASWMMRMLRNLRLNQLAKGYKRTPEDGRGRIVFVPGFDTLEGMVNPLTDLCDPESILIATEDYNAVMPV